VFTSLTFALLPIYCIIRVVGVRFFFYYRHIGESIHCIQIPRLTNDLDHPQKTCLPLWLFPGCSRGSMDVAFLATHIPSNWSRQYLEHTTKHRVCVFDWRVGSDQSVRHGFVPSEVTFWRQRTAKSFGGLKIGLRSLQHLPTSINEFDLVFFLCLVHTAR